MNLNIFCFKKNSIKIFQFITYLSTEGIGNNATTIQSVSEDVNLTLKGRRHGHDFNKNKMSIIILYNAF